MSTHRARPLLFLGLYVLVIHLWGLRAALASSGCPEGVRVAACVNGVAECVMVFACAVRVFVWYACC